MDVDHVTVGPVLIIVTIMILFTHAFNQTNQM